MGHEGGDLDTRINPSESAWNGIIPGAKKLLAAAGAEVAGGEEKGEKEKSKEPEKDPDVFGEPKYEFVKDDKSKEAIALRKLFTFRPNDSSLGTAGARNPLELHKDETDTYKSRVEFETVEDKDTKKREAVMHLYGRPEVVLKGQYKNFFLEGYMMITPDPRLREEHKRSLLDNAQIGFRTTGELAKNWTHEMKDGYQVTFLGGPKKLRVTRTETEDDGETVKELKHIGPDKDVDLPEKKWVKVQMLRQEPDGLFVWMNSGLDVKTRADLTKLKSPETATRHVKNDELAFGADIQGNRDRRSNNSIVFTSRESTQRVQMQTSWKGIRVWNLDEPASKDS